MSRLTDIERKDYEILRVSLDFMLNVISSRTLILTGKVLSIRIEEKDRLVLLGGIHELRSTRDLLVKRYEDLKKRIIEEGEERDNDRGT